MGAATPYNLALETSGRIGSVAIGQGPLVLQSATFRTTLNHGVELLPTVDRLCRGRGIAPGDIALLCFSGGPGSFTGLRIAATVARMARWAGGAKVVRVPTLDVIAQNALDLPDPPAHLAVVLDAKRGNVYAACFARRNAAYQRHAEAREWDPGRFLASLPRPCAVMGEGVTGVAGLAGESGLMVVPEDAYRARAEVVYRLGLELAASASSDDPAQLLPIYIRRPEAEEVWERRHRGDPDENDSAGAG